ncbi:hypothetical protein BIFADO_00012, partial [Bifidobacterium adolescentis L2-32]
GDNAVSLVVAQCDGQRYGDADALKLSFNTKRISLRADAGLEQADRVAAQRYCQGAEGGAAGYLSDGGAGGDGEGRVRRQCR